MNKSRKYQAFLLALFLLLCYNTLSLKEILPGLWKIPVVGVEMLFTASFSLVVSITAYYITVLFPMLVTKNDRKNQLHDEISLYILGAEKLLESTGLVFRNDFGDFFEDAEEMKRVNKVKGPYNYCYREGKNKTNLGHKLRRLKVLRDRLIQKKASLNYFVLWGTSAFSQLDQLTKSPLFHPSNDYLSKSESDLEKCEIGVWGSLLEYRKRIENVKNSLNQ